jgi:hypothetical protein
VAINNREKKGNGSVSEGTLVGVGRPTNTPLQNNYF